VLGVGVSRSFDSIAFRQSLLRLLEGLPPQEERLFAELKSLKGRRAPVYSTLIYILSHLSFSEREARKHWKGLLAHRRGLESALGRDVGLRVALLDYFVNVSRDLKNPKVIEIAIYESTERSATTDGLTGLANHAHFLQAARRELLRSRRYRLPMSLVLMDLDDFKRVNDSCGHIEGDRFLVKAAALMRESLREIDLGARYGGEEFALLLPDTQRTGAYVVADRVRARLEALYRRRKGAGVATLSGGIAAFPEDGDDVETLLRRADEALYRAKADGKNRVVLVSGERRRHARVSLVQRVKVTPISGRTIIAQTRDVSDGGLLVALRRALPTGSPIGIELPLPQSRSIHLRGVVVRVHKEARDPAASFAVGVRLAPENHPGWWHPLASPHPSLVYPVTLGVHPHPVGEQR
jgi:diguanylate cyclase (GGDEF)-like protein